MDGMHRVARLLLEGSATIAAVRFVQILTPTTATAGHKTFLTIEADLNRRGDRPEAPKKPHLRGFRPGRERSPQARDRRRHGSRIR
jgi:hypothetical protein